MAPPSKSKAQKQARSTKKPQLRDRSDRKDTPAVVSQHHVLPLELQHIILNTFTTAFPVAEDADELKHITQEVKGHLFNRDFSAAFGQPSYLQAYALRWSAARALGYSHILTHAGRDFLLVPFNTVETPGTTKTIEHSSQNQQDPDSSSELLLSTRVLCIGGGAGAEIVALAAAGKHLHLQSCLEIIAVDSADWSASVKQLFSAFSTPPPLSMYASEAARVRPENRPLVEDSSKVSVSFIHQDVLEWQNESMKMTTQGVSLCTIMFTLNELFSTSLPKTTSFLLRLTNLMRTGSYLLVVDSPGSYSELQLGKEKQAPAEEGSAPTKKYPMKWLLDHTLLSVAGKDEDTKWEKVESEDSLWYRIDQKDRLKYPVELENMRYQLHLYRKI
ncbi:hypothetical protein H2198_002126 [Neophaeococcomyces mojaviensis]|uniref:Uncharacterized protein n=1 Tax=Neophaeococcomyces mojaviensis TaxID=3383035 RepID=A0ACC3AFL5_9EURO|nr:hypothetical protein H2198_002126 [Knufia sp. JES_112]